jgi:hypothetical protein
MAEPIKFRRDMQQELTASDTKTKISRASLVLRWSSLSDWESADPFIGLPYPVNNVSNENSTEKSYTAFNKKPRSPYLWEPDDGAFRTAPGSDFRYFGDTAYRQANVKNIADDSIVNVPKKLYPFLSDNDLPSNTTTESYLGAIEKMVAVVC